MCLGYVGCRHKGKMDEGYAGTLCTFFVTLLQI